MKKVILFLFFFALCLPEISAQLLTINNATDTEANYSLQELIENVLISGPCAEVDTFSEQSNGNPTDNQTKSYGFFKRPAGNTFPFEEGLILTTGVAFAAGNTVNAMIVNNTNNLAGDADLATALSQTGLADATFVKFSFVPTTTSISFRFLMASEEYDGVTECQFADSFAFLLRLEGSTVYSNLAVLPDNTPISVTNINDANSCRSNRRFFAGYDVGNTNYGGRTKMLTATASVIPNQRYEIKLVVADQGDLLFDSAIFLEAGSFDLGANLGAPRLVNANNAVCDTEVLLDANIVANSYEWFKDLVPIPGENNQTYNANLGNGNYKVIATLAASCTAEDEIAVEFVTPATINPTIINFYACDNDNDGNAIFNLTSKGTEILFGQSITEFEVLYFTNNTYTTIATTPNAFSSSGQTIYTRVQNRNSSNCFADASFEIIMTNSVAEIPANIPKLSDCDNVSVGSLTDGRIKFNLETNQTIILNTQNSTYYTLTYFTDANYTIQIPTTEITSYTNVSAQQIIYVQMTNNSNANCFDRTSFEIEVYPNPVLVTPITIKQCDDDIDGFSDIDITLANTQISANTVNETFTFYTTQALAQAGVVATAIQNPTNYNTNTQTIWVNVVNNTTHCSTVGQINIIVSASNTTYNTTLYTCDDAVDTRDGTSLFDLTQVSTDVINRFPVIIHPNLTLSFYKSVTEAQLQSNEIINSSTYRNVATNTDVIPERIFIRVNNNTNLDCAGLGVNLYVDLVVEKLPFANPINTIRSCDIGANTGSFDTSMVQNMVLALQTNVTLTYFDENHTPILPTLPNPFISTGQTITIRATNNNTNISTGNACFEETTLEFIVDTLPIANPVTIQALCDDKPNDTDGFSEFDTTTIEATLLGGTLPPNTEVHYYLDYYGAKIEILPTLPGFFNTQTVIVTAEVVNTTNPTCIATTDILFEVKPDNPVFTISDQLLCLDLLPVGLTVTIENPQDTYDYFWENDKGEQIGTNADFIEITKGGEYTVTATTTASACSVTKMFFVTESSIPQIETINIFDDSPNNRISVLVSGDGDYEFALDNGTFVDANEEFGHVFYNVLEGGHTIHVRDENGCLPVVSKDIAVIRFPRFITPNNDAINDHFYVIGSAAFAKSSVYIMDRYGKVIADISNNTSWDGTYLGKKVPNDDYWFYAEFFDSNGKKYERQGHFSLKR